LTNSQIKSLEKTGKLSVKLSVDNGGGLAVYGKEFGRYAFDPSIVLLK
jgi:predicted transcriptional regulator